MDSSSRASAEAPSVPSDSAGDPASPEAAPASESLAPEASPGGAGPGKWEWSFANPVHLVASIIMLVSLVMVLFNLQDASVQNANTGSRYATIQALVDQGTYAIDDTRYVRTPDKKKAKGHYISSKPPLLPTYGAAVYWAVKHVTGKSIVDNEGVVVWTVSLFTGWLSHLVFLVYFYRWIRLVLRREMVVLITLSAGAFAYLGAAYATAINNHSTGAALLVAGFYYAFRVRNGFDAKPRHWVFAGLLLGVLSAIDIPSTAFSGLIGIYLLTYDWKKTLLLFAPAVLPGLATGPILNYITTGSLIPAYVNPEVSRFAGNYFAGRRSGIDALKEPKAIYLFHALIGHHGLFSMTPLTLFGFYELVRHYVRRDKRLAETMIVSIGTAVVIGFYIIRTRNYGGWCVGMRWFVPVMPLFLFYFGLWLDRVRIGKVVWGSVLAAFLVSAYNVQDGLGSPFQFSRWHNLLENAPNRNRLTDKMNVRKAKKRSKPKKGSRKR